MRVTTLAIFGLIFLFATHSLHARDLEYRGNGEIIVRVQPGEPTEVRFPGKISGGFRKRQSSLSLDRKDSDLIVFANEAISEDEGEALIVRLEDGRSYPVRIQRASDENPRDPQLKIVDKRDGTSIIEDEEEELPFQRREFGKKNPQSVEGFMKELVLSAEFGKKKIPGYRVSDRFSGETILSDGTMTATVDRIYVGPNLWGYVIDATNEMDVSQQVNPASFRLDGTRAISLSNWELAPKPLNIEQQIAGKHKTKVYVITRPKK